ncbi:MAG: flavin reductase family protein [Eubacteriaceae bacterium]|jgi:Conserved protein/domain typically associated with flavoprotein oxygenases, DIM6/NTAB family|nr:flavin reductase family protein [Eubacteriaceae bacterium]
MLEKDSLNKAFTYIEPGPVTLVTTREGRKNNICTISWMMAINYSAHCHIAVSTGPWNHTFQTLMGTRECCVCIPQADMAETVVGIGTVSGEEIDKFREFGLTPVKAEIVKAPLIEECIASLECRVIDYIEEHGLVILQCEQLWVDKAREFDPMLHANGDGTFRVDSSRVINLRDKMRMWVPEGSERF